MMSLALIEDVYIGEKLDHRHMSLKVPNVVFDFDVRFSTLMSNLTSKMVKLGSFIGRRPSLS